MVGEWVSEHAFDGLEVHSTLQLIPSKDLESEDALMQVLEGTRHKVDERDAVAKISWSVCCGPNLLLKMF